jgi:competence protein ComEC
VEATLPTPPLSVRAPLLVPAMLVVAAAWLAVRMPWLPVPLVVALGAAGLALGRRLGSLIVWAALGLLWAQVRWAGPRESFLVLQPGRPVTLSGDVAGCWAADEGGESAWLAVDQVAQGGALRRTAARVRVHLPRRPSAGACGGRLSVRGYLRPPKTYRNAVVTEVGGWSLWVKGAGLAESMAPPDLLSRAAGAARSRLFPFASDDAERPGLRLARALLLGDGNALPPLQREAMRRVGLAHLVAVSGLNVGMVATVFFALLLRAPRGLRLAGTMAGVLAYALLVGPLPSLLRALLMAAVVLGALMLRRLPAALNGLAVSCLLLVLLDPSWVEDLGFQLSVAATGGLLALSAPLRRCLRSLGPLATPLAVTLAAQLATLPWSLAAFGRLSPVSPLANLIAIPWSGVALVVALAWASLRLTIGAAADVILPLLDLLAAPLAWLERLPASRWITWPQQAPWWCAWAMTVLLMTCILLPRPRWSVVARLGIVIAIVIGAWPRAAPAAPELVMIDVGQGDAILLRDGNATLLIDGGGWRRPGFGGRVLFPALTALGVRQLDVLAVTHPDSDHCGGAADLLRELPVGQVWAPPGIADTPCGTSLHVRNTPYRELAAGDVARLARWRLRVLNPERNGQGADNHRSLVLLAEAVGRRALLTGDLDAAGEAALLRRWGAETLKCDLLKVAHHGSPSSSIPPFLRAAAPRLALISVGAGNAYGHPSPKVLVLLDRDRIPILRTDRDGMVRVQLGHRWRLQTTAP